MFKATITAAGNTQESLEMALEEALRKVKQGYTSGGDRNEDSWYTINVDTE